MANLSMQQVVDLAYQAGIRDKGRLALAGAIAKAENVAFEVDKLGDIALEDAKWGPSIGLWQIRTLKAETGKGTIRDVNKLRGNPKAQAASMYAISGGGSNWQPWSTYTSGAYKKYVAEAQGFAATANGSTAGGNLPGDTSSAGGAGAAGGEDGPNAYWDPNTAPFTGTTLDPVPQAPRDPLDIMVLGQRIGDLLDNGSATGSIEMTSDQVPEVKLNFIDPELRILQQNWLDYQTPFSWNGWDLELAGYDLSPTTDGITELVVTLWPSGTGWLRNDDPGDNRAHLTPGQWIEQECQRLFPHIAVHNNEPPGTATRSTIGPGQPQTDQNGNPTKLETRWETMQRLASEEGCKVWMDIAGIVVYGRPSLIMRRSQFVDVGYNGSLGDDALDCTALPVCHVKRAPTNKLETFDATVKLPRWRGEAVRPGMALRLGGVPRFSLTRFVSKVSWPLDMISDVDIETVYGIDPEPTRKPAGVAPAAASNNLSAASTPSTGTKSALDFVAFCQKQVGKPYVYGAEASLSDPDPKAFDCSELVQWACAQVGLPNFPDGSGNQYAAIKKAGLLCSIDKAATTRGALLFLGKNGSDHVVVSLGDGKGTVEARGKAYGVVNYQIASRGWSSAGLIPGMKY